MAIQPIPLEPGMRVRCVDAKWHMSIEDGAEYVVDRMKDDIRVHLCGHEMAYYAARFKPIVRVKMNSERPISASLINRTEHVGSFDLGTHWCKRWVERSDGSSIFGRAHG